MAAEKTFGWDDEIEATSSTFSDHITPGEYSFTVTAIHKRQFKGSAKLPECKMAVVELDCDNGTERGRITDRLYLCESQKWKITQFFKCIGAIDPMLPDGTSYRMDWDGALGRTGKVRVDDHEYTKKKDGTQAVATNVASYLMPAPKKAFGGDFA